MNTVYIGYDPRETDAYWVARHSLYRQTKNVEVVLLDADELFEQRLLWRPTYAKTIPGYHSSAKYDHLSDAFQSTDFAISRFLVPHIHKKGWALFVDCDVVFLGDVRELFSLADSQYAVMVVKHCYDLNDGLKMDKQVNLPYRRKNWSSVMLINCDHIAHTRMPVPMINQWPGLLLHQFAWLKDDEIGTLPKEWNWLVNVTEKPHNPKLAHFTLGGPWIDDWKPQPYDDIWLAEKNNESLLPRQFNHG